MTSPPHPCPQSNETLFVQGGRWPFTCNKGIHATLKKMFFTTNLTYDEMNKTEGYTHTASVFGWLTCTRAEQQKWDSS